MTHQNTPLSPERARATFKRFRHNNTLRRGVVSRKKLNTQSHFDRILSLTLLGGILLSLACFLIMPIKHIPFPLWMTTAAQVFRHHPTILSGISSIAFGFQASIFLMDLYLFYPIMALLLYPVFFLELPKRSIFNRFSEGHFLASFCLLAFLATCLVYQNNATALFHLFAPTHLPLSTSSHVHLATHASTHHHLVKKTIFLITWGILWITFLMLIPRLLPKDHKTSIKNTLKTPTGGHRDDFSLYLGKSTGTLSKRSHEAGIAPNQKINLSAQDAALNILILGGIGEGKTSSVINALLLQLLDQDCGGLIFDVKGSFHETVTQFAELTDTKITTVGPGKQTINLLAKLKPEVAADIIGSIFLMTSENKGDSFWITQATNLCRGALGLLSHFPEHYTLEGLRQYIFDEQFRDTIDTKLSKKNLTTKAQALLESYRASLTMFYSCRDKMQEDIRSTAATALSLFTHPDIKESFCSYTDEPLHLEDVLDGTIFLVNVPKSKYGQASRIIHAIIKMRWFHVMQARRLYQEWNQDRLVFFMCDEYQSLVTANPTEGSISDLSFWDKSRESKTIGIISAQSISSFYSTLSRDLADTVLQNFRQRLCFKTEDDKTLRHLQHIAGDVMVANHSESRQEGKSKGDKHTQTSTSASENLNHIRQNVIDSQLMRLLEPNQVIALLNIKQRSMDDIINLQPIYLEK